jgi:integrase
MAGRQKKRREQFGQVDKLPSGRQRARYTGPDGERYSAPHTFDNITDARTWLAARQTDISTGKWVPPAALAAAEAKRNQTLGTYAEAWLSSRTNSRGDHLKPRTQEEYKRLLSGPLSSLTPMLLGAITPATVRIWRAEQLNTGKKTQTSRAYGLLTAVMNTAVGDRLIDSSPCTVKGGQATHTGRKVVPPTDTELDAIIASIRREYRALVVAAAFGGLRYGEATALRAKDVTIERDEDGQVTAVRLNVERGVVRTNEGIVPGSTKSEAGVRRVGIFGSDAEIIAEHARDLIGDRLLFPAADGVNYLTQSTFHRHWDSARKAAGRSDMPFHALRHYSATAYAEAGATAAENNARHGWSTATVGLRYQHATDRADELAARMRRRTTTG